MRLPALIVPTCLLLAACSSGESVDAKNETPAEVASKVAASGMLPRPGRWEGTLKLTSMDMPGMPAATREAMNKSLGAVQRQTTCLTAEQAGKMDGSFFQKAAPGCTYEKFTMEGGKIDAVMVCPPGAGPTRMAMNGTYGADAYDLKISGSGEMTKGVAMNMAMEVSSRRIGDCTGNE